MKPRIAPSCSATIDARMRRAEALEARDDVGGPGRIALVGEQRRDRVGVGWRGRAKRHGRAIGRLVGHVPMVPGSPSSRNTCRPSRTPRATSRSGPNGPARRGRRARRPGRSGRRANQTTAGPLAQSCERLREPALGGGLQDRDDPGWPAGRGPAPGAEDAVVGRVAERAEPRAERLGELPLGSLRLDRHPSDGDRPGGPPAPAAPSEAVAGLGHGVREIGQRRSHARSAEQEQVRGRRADHLEAGLVVQPDGDLRCRRRHRDGPTRCPPPPRPRPRPS